MNRQQNTAVEYYPTNQETIPDNVTTIDVFRQNAQRLVEKVLTKCTNQKIPKINQQDKIICSNLNNYYMNFTLEQMEARYNYVTNNCYGKTRREELALLRIAYHEKIKNTSQKR